MTADRATYDLVAPKFISYVEEDQKLNDAEKGRWANLIASWRIRLEKWEGVSR